MYIYIYIYNLIEGILVNVLASNEVDRVFEPRSGRNLYLLLLHKAHSSMM